MGSWELCLKEVASTLGYTSAASMRDSLPVFCRTIAQAQQALHSVGLVDYIFDWEALMDLSRRKRQHDLTRQLQDVDREGLLRVLPEAARIDLRSAGGSGAGGFLEPFLPSVTIRMPDAHLRTALRARFGLPSPGFDSALGAATPATHCHHRYASSGDFCGQPVVAATEEGPSHDPLLCDIGQTYIYWHNRLRDYIAQLTTDLTGAPAPIEQIVPAWCLDATPEDIAAANGLPTPPGFDVRAAKKRVAKLDVGGLLGSQRTWIDVGFTCARTTVADERYYRAANDGYAAAQYVATKRRRYPVVKNPSEPLVPFIIEAFGRPSIEATAFLRSVAPTNLAERTQVLSAAWQTISCLTQMRLAELYLSAEQARSLR